jgi:spoIIIJ-associated protein
MGLLRDLARCAGRRTAPREEEKVEDAAEFSGRTIEDAVSEAETALGRGRQDLEVEILSHGSRGVFGIGAEQARIRARIQDDVAIATALTRPRDETIAQSKIEPPTERSVPEPGEEAPSEPEDSTAVAPRDAASLAEEATKVLQELLRTMNFDAEVHVQNLEDPLTLGVTGENLGVLIGRRGDNLAALQFMVNLILSKGRRQWPRVVLDVENYRARREESLQSLAERVAYRVQRNGRPFTLEAMPASDRRVIHIALRERNDVETYSIGEGPSRRVVVAPKRPARSGASRW